MANLNLKSCLSFFHYRASIAEEVIRNLYQEIGQVKRGTGVISCAFLLAFSIVNLNLKHMLNRLLFDLLLVFFSPTSEPVTIQCRSFLLLENFVYYSASE
ncbi:hypothetical protein BCM0060_1198 [Bacillus cereus]|nr:hypothetical protein BCM0060_1198 [Bacillus cereus]BCC16740.1 hypothetical protein BCM0075_1510 [Bacillus cereus]GMB74812.1 hypothetical protein BCER1_12130 [Bacillus cereus]